MPLKSNSTQNAHIVIYVGTLPDSVAHPSSLMTCGWGLRVPVCKNQTKSKFRGKSGKFDSFHILMLDSLGYN